ncbi:CHAT domain-containing protein [Streptomyces sp. NPDC057445]|uniref:CHAT domain-containing protein n=1 Tax=Streptomyces sp. NPDC057445 TaxID=3346136 RepID=UPI0036A51DE0
MIELQKERGAEFERAAKLFDSIGDVKDAGRSWYCAASEYNVLGLVLTDYRGICYHACKEAAARMEASGDWWGKGLSESLAGQTFRQEIGQPPDPRNLPSLQAAVESFTVAGRPLETAAALMTVAVEQTRSPSDDEWMASAVRALHSYEKARPGLQLPHERERWDTVIINSGVRPLASKVRKAVDDISDNPRWDELIWLLVEAPKARSFQDQQMQNEAWTGLVSSDSELSAIVGEKEQAERDKARIEREIGALLVAGMPDLIPAEEETFRDAEERFQKANIALVKRLDGISRESPEQADIVSIPPVSYKELQRSLNPGEAYITYRWNGGAPLRSTVTRTSYSADVAEGISVPFARRAAADAIAGRVPYYATPSDTDQLIGQIPDSVDTLIISPDALLHGMPWNDLPTSGGDQSSGTLGDHFPLAVVPAAGFLHQLRSEHLRRGPIPRDRTYTGVACRGGGGEQPLEYADWEVKAAKENYFANDSNSIALTTDESSEFLAEGCNTSLLHLACHAERHGLLLSQNGTWTTPVDLLKAPKRTFGADILLLTGCYAGDFSKEDSNEFLGILRQLMIITGARAAVTSVAPVDDAAGPLFSDMLLSALTGAQPERLWSTPSHPFTIGKAVGWVRRTMRKLDPPPGGLDDIAPGYEDPTPFDPSWWAPWFIVGDPSVNLIQ